MLKTRFLFATKLLYAWFILFPVLLVFFVVSLPLATSWEDSWDAVWYDLGAKNIFSWRLIKREWNS